uniref:glutaminase n=1 Tax=Callorhinchus milii TaxID=7868 RepID=A0A4W3I3F9_CALMI
MSNARIIIIYGGDVPDLCSHSRSHSCSLALLRSLSLSLPPSLPHFVLRRKHKASLIHGLEDLLFYTISHGREEIPVPTFIRALKSTGLLTSDPRLKQCMDQLREATQSSPSLTLLDRHLFRKFFGNNTVLLSQAFRKRFIIPDFETFSSHINRLYGNAKSKSSGNVADYIPQLAKFSPDLWGVSLCTVDGQRYSVGDTKIPFCLQSCVKPLVYAIAVNEFSTDHVHYYMGKEPSGLKFNKLFLNEEDKPHNPMVNAGAIIITSLIKRKGGVWRGEKGRNNVAFFSPPPRSRFQSEKETGDRNFAIGYYLKEKRCFPDGANMIASLDLYFQLCSIEMTCESGSVIAATLANGGICPITEQRVLSTEAVRNTLSLMHSCGMYDFSGEFAFHVGLPAKSGVSGGVLLVVPNVMGVMCWSPPLDKVGNSVRGINFCQELVSLFNFHNYDNLRHFERKLDPRRIGSEVGVSTVNLLFAAYSGDTDSLRRFALSGMDMQQKDYDLRTPLHIAAAEGHEEAVRFLLHACHVNPLCKDRWGNTPLDDALHFNHPQLLKLLSDDQLLHSLPGQSETGEAGTATPSKNMVAVGVYWGSTV